MFRLFLLTFAAGPVRLSGIIQLTLSLPHITLYISIKSPLSRLSFKVVKRYLFDLSLFIESERNSWTLSIQSMTPCKRVFQACSSKCVLSRETYIYFYRQDPYSNVLFNIPSIMFAFAIIVFSKCH